MTAYECLIDDLLKVLTEFNFLPKSKRKYPFDERKISLFTEIAFSVDKNDDALKYLYAYRNCLTHNAGIVDDNMINKISRIGPLRDGPKVGHPLVLTPSVATSFANSVQLTAHRLLDCVQNYCNQSNRDEE